MLCVSFPLTQKHGFGGKALHLVTQPTFSEFMIKHTLVPRLLLSLTEKNYVLVEKALKLRGFKCYHVAFSVECKLLASIAKCGS